MRGEGATPRSKSILKIKAGWDWIQQIIFGPWTLIKGTGKTKTIHSVSTGHYDGRHYEEMNDVQLEEMLQEINEQINYIEQ